MHLMDCKGVAAIKYGSILSWTVKQTKFGANMPERMRWVNMKRSAWYDGRQGTCRLPKLKLQNLTNASGWSDLHGSSSRRQVGRNCGALFHHAKNCIALQPAHNPPHPPISPAHPPTHPTLARAIGPSMHTYAREGLCAF